MIGTDLETAAKWLKKGRTVAIPTETVYGLAGNAFDTDAVLEIFSVKNRPQFNPLIVHTDSVEKAQSLVSEWPEKATLLWNAFAPGPLTLLLPKKSVIPDLITAGSPLVAIRIPAHPMALALLRMLDFPLAAPSANPFTYISPTTAQHVAAQLGDKIPYILDGGPCTVGLESTIIGFDENQQPILYRAGGIAREAIEAIVGPLIDATNKAGKPATPGQLLSHYAPSAALYLGDIATMLPKYDPFTTGLITFQHSFAEIPATRQIALSPSGDLNEAARNLFGALRKLDALPLTAILAEPVPDHGLGRAINDRLRRATADRKGF